MREHRFHQALGKLVNQLGLTLGKDIWKAPECDGPKQIPLQHCVRSKCVQFCLVDMLIIQPDMIVVIEIEESDVKPLHLFGKFFATAFSTHFNGLDIRKLPLLFIQVVDTSKVNLDEGQKDEQWDRIEEILSRYADEQQEKKVRYKMFRGRSADFEEGGQVGTALLDGIRKFPMK